MTKLKSLKRSNSVIKVAVRALHKSISRTLKGQAEIVPEDVKEGHFVVFAVRDENPKRFVLPLNCLSDPLFLRLLALAEEEFGFCQEGAIAIPCSSNDLDRIVESSKDRRFHCL